MAHDTESSTSPGKLDIAALVTGADYQPILSRSVQELAENVSHYYTISEHPYITQLYPIAFKASEAAAITEQAAALVQKVREADHDSFFDIDALLQEYCLNHEDGVTLMCLAEALLRIPDTATVDALIEDKLSHTEWLEHLNSDNSLFVNASTWGLAIAGRWVDAGEDSVARLFKQTAKPVIRLAVNKAMKMMGEHFVLGRTIDEAMDNARAYINKGYDYSYDMLGESAITAQSAHQYFESYANAIEQIAQKSPEGSSPSLSIKLSALHPRLEETQRTRVLEELVPVIKSLVAKAQACHIGVTIDAEEADRLELTMAIFEAVYSEPSLRGWGKFGLVVQAYSKRALPLLCWLAKLAHHYGDRIPVRLVKGAYWDSEIKRAQVAGLKDYPVFSHKAFTDTAYLACARVLLGPAMKGLIFPQFATHNAHTVASIKVMAGNNHDYEFQRLHGMGDQLYHALLSDHPQTQVRIYAPVGSHQDLLPYLVRRLLENGANSSFVHQLADHQIPIEYLIKQPLTEGELAALHKPSVKKPESLFNDRQNSRGVNLACHTSREALLEQVALSTNSQWQAAPVVDGSSIKIATAQAITSPHNHQTIVGHQYYADAALAIKALTSATNAFPLWDQTPVLQRVAIIEKAAELMEVRRAEFIALCQREAGKTLADAIDEVREAVDFCRYYAADTRVTLAVPTELPGPTGELNQLSFRGRGVFVCISPWNFPLAIFTGQVVAALLAGNTVIAKPAEQTPLIAAQAIQCLYDAGLPKNALQFLPGPGAELGNVLNADKRVSGVAFTGSTATAHRINQTLVNRGDDVSLATVIAETGGLNAVVVDSTALPEQVAVDAVHSAFNAAGQRCSALRVLFVQDDIADHVIDLIKGAMQQLCVGNPEWLATDIGPIIDPVAQQRLLDYIETTRPIAIDCFQVTLPEACAVGSYVAPTLIELANADSLTEEHFGPILHVVRFGADALDQVIATINGFGYGLTLGIHSRNDSTQQTIAQKVSVGNVYINRNQIGAVVGVTPFGGCGLSGTGPKAGGPNYLKRFATEKTITHNTVAVGGNIDLLKG